MMDFYKGIEAYLNGRNVRLVVPICMDEITMEDIRDYKNSGAYFVEEEPVNEYEVAKHVMSEIENLPIEERKLEQEEPKKTRLGRKPKVIDDGRIAALYRANWSINKIADDIGAPWINVKSHIDKMIEEGILECTSTEKEMN